MLKKIPAKWFLVIYLPLLITASAALILVSKPGLHLSVNRLHSAFSDQLMRYWTLLGDGVVLLILCLVMLFISMRHFLTAFAAYAFGGVGAQLLKRLFFSEIPRPVKYFEIHEPERSLRLVEGVDVHAWFSFPSGHTATAFAFFFALALMTKNRILQVIAVCAAAGVGLSRVYLSQHFLVDVVGGSVLGMGMGLLAWWWIGRFNSPWMDKPLHQVVLLKFQHQEGRRKERQS